MPSATILHAAFFAAGAVVGGGLAAAVTNAAQARNLKKPSIPNLPTSSVVNVTPTGTLEISKSTTSLLPGTVLKYGNPGPISDLLTRKVYVTAYDRRMRHPAWTAEHLTLSSLGPTTSGEPGDRSRSTFAEDESLPAVFRAKLHDYFRSGYDRGHMVPAADAKSSQAAMDETFLLSNIAPQVGAGFNRHYWAYLEDWCRRLTGSFSDVFVFTIPLYLPKLESDGKWRVSYEVIGTPPTVAVPTHFAKVLLVSKPMSLATPDAHEISTGAFVLPNASIPDDTPLESFLVPVEAVERATGLVLFSDDVKSTSKQICRSTTCQLIVRHFDDAQNQSRRPEVRRVVSAPR